MPRKISNILVPVSGGKDSTACLLLAMNKFPNAEILPVFNDTGWEHPLTYEYLDYLEGRLSIKIHRTIGGKRRDKQDAKTLPNLVKAQGRFPFGLGRFCTTHLKQYALRDYYRDFIYEPLKPGTKSEDKYRISYQTKIWEFWFGMRTQESSQRSKKYAGISYSDTFDINDIFPGRYGKKLGATIRMRLPVVEWNEAKIFRYLKHNKVDANPLYFEGTNDRVGCYPCMLASKKVQTRMFNTEFGKQRLLEIKQLELDIGQKYKMFDTDQGSCEVCKI